MLRIVLLNGFGTRLSTASWARPRPAFGSGLGMDLQHSNGLRFSVKVQVFGFFCPAFFARPWKHRWGTGIIIGFKVFRGEVSALRRLGFEGV